MQKTKSKPKYRNKKWLYQKYIKEGKSALEIGNLVGVDSSTIYNWLEKNNIERRQSGRYKGETVTLICEQCGKDFEVNPHKQSRKFCSEECAARSRSQKFDQKITLTCRQCGEEYRVKPSRASKSKFCSEKCKYDWIANQRSGKGNPMYGMGGEKSPVWKGGNSIDEYRNKRFDNPGNWQKNKQKALERDNHTCQFCGAKENGRKHDVHHIKPVREGGNNYVGNLISLCKSCHQNLEKR